jgi:GNAT superfamily N-acetyltransferase
MDIETIRELYDRHERREAAFPRCRREASGKTVRMISLEAGGHSFVIHSSLGAGEADAAIEEELRCFRGLGLRFEWKLYSHDRPADLKERLAAHGFRIGEDEAIMALELEGLPPELAREHPHDLRRVADEAGLRDYAAVNAAAWPEDAEVWMEAIARTLREEPERLSAWVAYVEGKPVCAARVDFPAHSPFASLWGGATLEPFRRRGIYTAMLAARAREAIGRGYRFLTIDASPMSRPIVTRHGFRLLSISNPCDSPAEGGRA